MGIIDLSQLGREPQPQPRAAEMFDNLAEVQVKSALELAAQVTDPEVVETIDWLRDNSEVVTMYADRFGQPMVPESDKAIRISFVDDNSPALRWYPEMRRLPMYVHNLEAIFIPEEARSHGIILAAILGHEAKHALNSADPDFAARAHAVFPNTSAEEAARLVTEVEAFTLEGKLLDGLFGESFAQYIQSEVDAADKNAIENQKANNGLLIETGIDRPVVQAAIERNLSFISEQAETFCQEVLAVAVPLYASFRTVDQIFGRNDSPEDAKIAAKVQLLAHADYLY